MPVKTPCLTTLTSPSGRVTPVTANSVVRGRPYSMSCVTVQWLSSSGDYNTRHDKVLQIIYNLLKENLHTNQSIIADLQDLSPYIFPPHIAKTDLRPDIVVWNDTTRSVTLLELTVCHESNFVEAHQRKVTRYLDLEEEIQRSHFQVETIPIQVGCRGFVDIESFERVKALITCGLGIRKWRKFVQEISEATIKSSHSIWTSRNYRN